MAHELYSNFVIENKITTEVNTLVDVNALFTTDNSLTTEAGLTKKIYARSYEGTVEKLGKGAKNSVYGTVKLIPHTYTVERYQHAFQYNDMEVMEDPAMLDAAVDGAAKVMANDIRAKYFEQLAKIGTAEGALNVMEYDELTYDTIVDALLKIGREVESDQFLVMGLAGKAAIRHDNDYKASRQGEILYTGQFGTICGIPCVFTKMITNGDVYVTTKDAVKHFIKKDGSVEQDRDIETKDNTVVYERFGVMALVDETKSVKLTKA